MTDEELIEQVAELQLAAFLAGRGSVTGMKHGTRVAKPAPSMDDFRRMAQSAILPIIKAERVRGGEMVKRLRGYAAHTDECAINGWLPRGDEPCPPCTCGLTALIKEIEGD